MWEQWQGDVSSDGDSGDGDSSDGDSNGKVMLYSSDGDSGDGDNSEWVGGVVLWIKY